MLFHVHTAPTPRALNSNCLKLHQIAILCLQVEGRQAVFGRKAGLKLCLKSSQLVPHLTGRVSQQERCLVDHLHGTQALIHEGRKHNMTAAAHGTHQLRGPQT